MKSELGAEVLSLCKKEGRKPRRAVDEGKIRTEDSDIWDDDAMMKLMSHSKDISENC